MAGAQTLRVRTRPVGTEMRTISEPKNYSFSLPYIQGIYSFSMSCVFHLRFPFSLWRFFIPSVFNLHADCKALVKGSKNAGSMSLYLQIKKMTPRFFRTVDPWPLFSASELFKNLQLLSKDSDPRKAFKKITCRSAWPLQKSP